MADISEDNAGRRDGLRRERLKDVLSARYKKYAAAKACASCEWRLRSVCGKSSGGGYLLKSLLYSLDRKKNVQRMRSVLSDKAIDTADVPCEIIFQGKKAVKNYVPPTSRQGWLNEWEMKNDK